MRVEQLAEEQGEPIVASNFLFEQSIGDNDNITNNDNDVELIEDDVIEDGGDMTNNNIINEDKNIVHDDFVDLFFLHMKL